MTSNRMQSAFFLRRAWSSESLASRCSVVSAIKPFRIRRNRTDETAAASIAAAYSTEEVTACLICQEQMCATDLAHPVLCPNCTFNFCGQCIESLMQQNEKVHCPNCRSDLCATICDTLLLRKVDRHPHNNDFDTDEYNESSFLELKRAMDVDERLVQEIAAARDREGQFWARKETAASTLQQIDGDDQCAEEQQQQQKRVVYHEEWGVEVDLRIGAHESIKLPKEFQQSTMHSRADTTLLAGLDGAMSAREQEQATRYLISGDTVELALAAKLLAGIAEKVRGYQQQRERESLQTAAAAGEAQRKEESLLATIYQLIEAGKRARSRTFGNNSPRAVPSKKSPTSRVTNSYTKLATLKAAQHRLVQRQLREQLAYLKRHPLPARMPKYCEITVHIDSVNMNAYQIVKSLPFRFCNDTWDGTVMDAFAKIYVKDARPNLPAGKNYSPSPITSTFVDNYKVQQWRPVTDEGIRNILGGDDYTDVRMDIKHPRVLIAAVVLDSFSLLSSTAVSGVLPGDVVTQLNGMELRDDTVDDLMARICSLCYNSEEAALNDNDDNDDNDGEDGDDENDDTILESEAPTVRLGFVFNADQAVAKALQMRAAAISKMYY